MTGFRPDLRDAADIIPAENQTGNAHLSSEAKRRGELFILSAPSGAGKTTLIRGLMSGVLGTFEGLEFSVSHTTRRPRSEEREGEDYFFLERGDFEEMIAADRFLEWARVHDNYYGTTFDEVLPRLDAGIDVLVDIDVQGAERVMQQVPTAESAPLFTRVHTIFVMPPSFEVLADRLRNRGLDDPREVEGRLLVSRWEVKQVERYDYVIVNEDAESASRALASIILDKRHRRSRMHQRVREILADFAETGSATRPPASSPR